MGWSGQEGSAWIGRGGDPSAVATPFGDASGGSEASEILIDRLKKRCIMVFGMKGEAQPIRHLRERQKK